MTTVEDFQKLARDNVETAARAFGLLSKGLQGIAGEVADHAKTSLEEGTAMLQRLAGARSLDRVVEIETDGAAKAWGDLIARSARIGGLWVDLVHDVAAAPASRGPKPTA